MRVELPRGAGIIGRTDPLPVEPWMKQQVEASFKRVKSAILQRNFPAYLAELHPDVLAKMPFENIAKNFVTLWKTAGVEKWELDTLFRDQDGVGCQIKNAPPKTIAIFGFNGKETLKFAYLGEFSFP